MARYTRSTRSSSSGGYGGGGYGGGGYGGGYGNLNLSDLSPEELILLQQRLAQQGLSRPLKSRSSGGILGRIAGGIDYAVPGSGLVSRFLEQLAEGFIFSPVGLFYLGKGVGQDIEQIASPNFWTGRGEMRSHTADFLGQMASAIKEDVSHPLRNPGYLALDAFAAASLGAGSVARLGRASGAVRGLPPSEPGPLLPPGVPVSPRPPSTRPVYPQPVLEEVQSTFRPRVLGMQRDLKLLAEEQDPATASRLADAVLSRIDREKPSNERFQGLLDQVAPRGSEAQNRVHEHMLEAQARKREQQRAEGLLAAPEAPAVSPESSVPMAGNIAETQIPGQLQLEGFMRDWMPLREEARITPDVTEPFTPAMAEATDLVNAMIDLPEIRQGMMGAAPEYNLANLVDVFHQALSDPERIGQLRAAAENVAGLKQQRQQVAREVTGAAKEARQTENLLEEVGFRALDVPQVSELEASKRFPARTRVDAKGDEYIEIYDRELVRKGKPMPSEITVRSTRDVDRPVDVVPVAHIDPQTGELLRAAPRAQKVYRVLERGNAISDPILTRRDAIRLAQMHALERAKGIEPQARGLVRGDEPIGTLGQQAGALAQELGFEEPILARDALTVAREQVSRRKESRKAKGIAREEISTEEMQEILGGLEEIDADEVSRILEQAESPRSDVPADTPLEETPALKDEYVEHLKEEAPEEIHDVIDEIYDDLSMQNEVRGEPSQREARFRQEGLSDRQLGINPKALERAGLTRAQGNELREPLKEIRSKYGSKLTDEDVKEVIAETLHVSDEEATRIFEQMRGGKAMAAGEIALRSGSLKQHFKDLWKLDDAQAEEAATRFKEKVSPYMQELRESGGAPKREDLMRLLEEVFGPEKGREAFSRLYRISGGESSARVFLKEFFKAPPKERVLLSQPVLERGYETIFTPTYRRTAEGVRRELKQSKREVRREATEGVLVDLSRNPVRAGFQRWYYSWLNQAPAGGRRAKMRARKIKFEKGEVSRIEKYLQEAGMTPEQIAAARTPEKGASFGDYVDSMNQLAQIGVLYLKPAYIPPNMLGQILFTTIDHTWNPIAIARSFRMSREFARMNPDLLGAMRAGMGEGMYESLRPERGASKAISRVHGTLARGFGKILDVPFRDAAFFNEAYKHGYTTPESIASLLKAGPGSELYSDMVSVFKNANRNMVDYGRLSTTEKMLIRRVVFFYPWIKGSTIWAGRFASEHPGQALLMAQAAREGHKRTEDILGEVPSYMRGIIPVGSRDVPGLGKMPRIINPASFSVTGSAGEALSGLRALLFGGTQSEQLSEYFNPVFSAGLAAATRTDPFTGRSYESGESALDIFGQEIFQPIPAIRALQNIKPVQEALGLTPGKQGLIEQGKLDPEKTLLPTTRAEELGRFTFGLSPVTYNVQEGQSRAVAESLELRGSGEGALMKWGQRQKQSLEAARSAGALKRGENFPDYVNRSLSYQAKRDQMYEQVAADSGRKKSDLRQVDKLQADLRVLVAEGLLPEGQAMQLLLQYSNFDDNGISYLRRKLADSYFGLAQLYAYRRTLVSRGVDSSVLNGWDSP